VDVHVASLVRLGFLPLIISCFNKKLLVAVPANKSDICDHSRKSCDHNYDFSSLYGRNLNFLPAILRNRLAGMQAMRGLVQDMHLALRHLLPLLISLDATRSDSRKRESRAAYAAARLFSIWVVVRGLG
jgi:hypothetical protein